MDAKKFVVNVIRNVICAFVTWYGGWALLAWFGRVSTTPALGWWNWILVAFAIYFEADQASIAHEAQERTAGVRGFWGPYRRQMALGLISAIGAVVVLAKTGMVDWASTSPSDRAALLIIYVTLFAAANVIIAAGRRRDAPFLAALFDLGAGALIGVIVAGALYGFWLDVLGGGRVDRPWYAFAGALIGAPLNLWWRRGRSAGMSAAPSRREHSTINGIADFASNTAMTFERLMAFVKGLMWFGLALVLALWAAPGLWSFGDIRVWKISGWCAIGGAVLAFFKSLQEVGPALKGQPQLVNQRVHGDATDATPDDARRAMRGGGSSIDDRRLPS